jgi:hypothetical protein
VTASAGRSHTVSVGLFAAMWIFAAPFDSGPFRMLADPLRNVRLGIHGALLQGEIRRKCQMPFFTSVRREHGTNRDDQLDRIHAELLHHLALDSITSYETARYEVSPIPRYTLEIQSKYQPCLLTFEIDEI